MTPTQHERLERIRAHASPDLRADIDLLVDGLMHGRDLCSPGQRWLKDTPAAEGYYWYRWNNQECIYYVSGGKVWGMLSGEEQHPPQNGAEWFGPIKPTLTSNSAACVEKVGQVRRHHGVSSNEDYEQGFLDALNCVETALKGTLPT